MADETPPLDDERLAEIRRRVPHFGLLPSAQDSAQMIWELLGEVDHLRAELAVTRHAVDDWRDEYARLRAENARLLEERERWADTALIESERVADRSVTVAELRAREAAALEMLREMTDYSELTLGAVNGPLYRRARALLAGE